MLKKRQNRTSSSNFKAHQMSSNHETFHVTPIFIIRGCACAHETVGDGTKARKWKVKFELIANWAQFQNEQQRMQNLRVTSKKILKVFKMQVEAQFSRIYCVRFRLQNCNFLACLRWRREKWKTYNFLALRKSGKTAAKKKKDDSNTCLVSLYLFVFSTISKNKRILRDFD